MAKVLASNYRYITMKDGDDFATRHVLRPGDPASKLPKEARELLQERGQLVDESRFDKEQGVVIPPEEYIRRLEAEEEEEEEAEAEEEATTTSATTSEQQPKQADQGDKAKQ